MLFEASTWSPCLFTVYYMAYVCRYDTEYFGVINVFNAQNIVRD